MNEEDPVDSLLNVLNSFRSKILTIREMCENSSKFNEQEANSLLNEGIFDLIRIKNLNEIVQINCENKKDECNEIQDIVGKENLNEKKYQYHLDLIENDIYTNQQLPKLPESNKVLSEESKNNKIKIEMESFNNILLGRKRLDKQLNDLKEEKKKNEIKFKNKLNNMKDFPKYIEIIEKEAAKAKKLINDTKV